MTYTRPDHIQFLEEELKAITDEFKKKLDTQATSLLQESGELVLSTFYISSMIANEPVQLVSGGKQNMITDYKVLENDVLKHEQGGIEYNFFDYVIVMKQVRRFFQHW